MHVGANLHFRARRRGDVSALGRLAGTRIGFGELGALVLELLELALESLPRFPLGVLVVGALQLPQALAVGDPCLPRALVELLLLAAAVAIGGEGRHRAPPLSPTWSKLM